MIKFLARKFSKTDQDECIVDPGDIKLNVYYSEWSEPTPDTDRVQVVEYFESMGEAETWIAEKNKKQGVQ